ncbi:chromatin remodelling complex Rsc7/Swp82 subunit-domain-containing protein [Aspergillus venezuelensis]
MYGTSHSVSAPMNGIGGDLVDGSGTINPADLNNSNVSVVLPTPPYATAGAADPSLVPRGIKRARTPEQRAVSRDGDDDDESARRKRGRPPKPSSRPSTSDSGAPVNPQLQTPQMQPQQLQGSPPNASPPLASPPEKTTPSKAPLVKALPTVRDHTTDQLNEARDEYIPKEFDDAGEQKVDADGNLTGDREYRCRTFTVPLRGKKLFMLATECARVLSYRDSYLLFNKNRSLHKIIATQIEKDDLIQQDILPYSYRSRQIAIVSARSMFRQFGSRVIVNGRRVRDDYWESKARKQGFTEEDLAGEKRPGGAKAREAAAEAANAQNLLPTLGHGDVIYSNVLETMPANLGSMSGPLPMIHMATTTDDPRLREYTGMPRPRQEITGQPYQDRTQPSTAAEILNQATHTTDFNKILTSQRNFRQKGLDEFYAKQREAPVTAAQSQPEGSTSAAQPLQSPRLSTTGVLSSTPAQPNMMPQAPMVPSQAGFQPPLHQQPSVAQSPIRAMPPVGRPELMHQRSNPALAPQAYGYASQQQQMWGQPPPQPQASPLPSNPQGIPQYPSQMHQQPGSQPQQPQHQQSPSPLAHNLSQQHPSQSPRNQVRSSVPQMPQNFAMHHPQTPQQQSMASMGFPAGSGPYPTMAARSMYPSQHGPAGQPFMQGTPQQPGVGMGMNPTMPGWPGQPMQPGHPQPGWSTY